MTKELNLSDADLYEISCLVLAGFTSGILDNGVYKIDWSLKIEKWANK
jgi:hypothetical protein